MTTKDVNWTGNVQSDEVKIEDTKKPSKKKQTEKTINDGNR